MMNGTGSSSSEAINMVDNEKKKKLSALVVDDDLIIRLVNTATLKKLGITAEAVDDGQKAVDFHSQGKSFDMIFMDKDMPIKNGVQATRELRAMGVESTIVGVTSDNSEKGKEDFKDAGLDFLFAKPLTVDKVLSVLAKLAEI